MQITAVIPTERDNDIMLIMKSCKRLKSHGKQSQTCHRSCHEPMNMHRHSKLCVKELKVQQKQFTVSIKKSNCVQVALVQNFVLLTLNLGKLHGTEIKKS